MSRFLLTGHHQALLPARVSGAESSLRVWIEMRDVVTLLEKLDTGLRLVTRPVASTSK